MLDGGVSTFMENSGGANGLFFVDGGVLVACLGNKGQVVFIRPNGTVTILAAKYDGKLFNSPNDLWPDGKGRIYFTDPHYGRKDPLPQDGEHVYCLVVSDRRIKRVIDDMVRPNGIIGSRDGKTLYVADRGAKKTYAYTIRSNGTLSGKRLFAEEGSDGMTIDSEGNIYLTTEAVSVYDPNGNKIETIDIPEVPSNVCFGGRDNQTLFITARTSLYSIDMRVAGGNRKIYSFAGSWQGSSIDSQGNEFTFAAKVIGLGDHKYRVLVLDKLDTQNKPIHVMDGVLKDNKYAYTADGGAYIGGGELDDDVFEGYYEGAVDGTYKMHRVK